MEENYIINKDNFVVVIKEDEINITSKTKEDITLKDLEESVIEYLYKKFNSDCLPSENDVKLFEIIYKD